MVSNEDERLKERVDCDAAAVALKMRLLRRRGVVRGGKEDVVGWCEEKEVSYEENL